MKKKRRNKNKLALEWKDSEKYSPLMLLRQLPHTGETKVLRALPKPAPHPHPPAA